MQEVSNASYVHDQVVMHAGQDIWYTNGGHTSVVPILF